jgi:hypothetical protein
VRSASKFSKSANMIPKIFFFKFLQYGYKETQKFNAEFESVEKVAKKFTQREL